MLLYCSEYARDLCGEIAILFMKHFPWPQIYASMEGERADSLIFLF